MILVWLFVEESRVGAISSFLPGDDFFEWFRGAPPRSVPESCLSKLGLEEVECIGDCIIFADF